MQIKLPEVDAIVRPFPWQLDFDEGQHEERRRKTDSSTLLGSMPTSRNNSSTTSSRTSVSLRPKTTKLLAFGRHSYIKHRTSSFKYLLQHLRHRRIRFRLQQPADINILNLSCYLCSFIITNNNILTISSACWTTHSPWYLQQTDCSSR